MNTLLLSCEHGGNVIPVEWQSCFVQAGDVLETHRGYDLGALEMARFLARRMGAPLHEATVSRLLTDLNRSPRHPQRFSQWTRSLKPAERQQIDDHYYTPYRSALEQAIARQVASDCKVLHLSIHSFTPELNGEVRNADIGLLYDPRRPSEKAFCLALQTHLMQHWPATHHMRLRVRRNYPYTGVQDGFIPWLRRRFSSDVYCGVELEFNQNFLLKTPELAESSARLLCEFLKGWGAATAAGK